MDQKVTRLPQPTIGTSRQGTATQPHDLDKLIVAGQGAIDCWQAITAEMLAFWQSRLKDGLATGGRLLEATSVDSALEAQLEYAKAAMQAYLDQSARIARLLMRAIDRSFLAQPTTASSERGQEIWRPDSVFFLRSAPAAGPLRAATRGFECEQSGQPGVRHG